MSAKVHHVQGNHLRLAIPLQQIVRTLEDGKKQETQTDFTPAEGAEIHARLYKSNGIGYDYTCTLDGENIAILEDSGTLPVGVYSISVQTTDTEGRAVRYAAADVLHIHANTADAGIEAGTEFDAIQHTLGGTVFYFAKGENTTAYSIEPEAANAHNDEAKNDRFPFTVKATARKQTGNEQPKPFTAYWLLCQRTGTEIKSLSYSRTPAETLEREVNVHTDWDALVLFIGVEAFSGVTSTPAEYLARTEIPIISKGGNKTTISVNGTPLETDEEGNVDLKMDAYTVGLNSVEVQGDSAKLKYYFVSSSYALLNRNLSVGDVSLPLASISGAGLMSRSQFSELQNHTALLSTLTSHIKDLGKFATNTEMEQAFLDNIEAPLPRVGSTTDVDIFLAQGSSNSAICMSVWANSLGDYGGYVQLLFEGTIVASRRITLDASGNKTATAWTTVTVEDFTTGIYQLSNYVTGTVEPKITANSEALTALEARVKALEDKESEAEES